MAASEKDPELRLLQKNPLGKDSPSVLFQSPAALRSCFSFSGETRGPQRILYQKLFLFKKSYFLPLPAFSAII